MFVKAAVTCFILFSSDLVSFYHKKAFQGSSFQSVYESVFQSVPCFSHVLVITCSGTASQPQNLFTVNVVGDHNIGNHRKYSGKGTWSTLYQ